jgi:hypothetical protein
MIVFVLSGVVIHLWREVHDMENHLWYCKRHEIMRILEKHKIEVVELMDKTVDRLTAAYQTAMVVKAQKKAGIADPVCRSIDDE